MSLSVRWVLAGLLLFAVASPTPARPRTNDAALQQLAAELQEKFDRWRAHPEYQRLKAIRNGYWGELNADPERELIGVDEDGVPIILYTDNLNAAHTTRADALHPGGAAGYELDGSGSVGVAVWDNGVADINHPEFAGHLMVGDGGNPMAAHANHTCGTVAAAGVNASAKGMAYNTLLNSFDWADDRVEMAANASWIRVSSHSYHYGGGSYGVYDGSSADLDEIQWNAPYYSIVIAATNDGPAYNTIYPSSLGKNAICVGAVHDVPDYTGPGSVSIAGFSSRGPTVDGRIKPDIVGNGVNLYSTLGGGNYTYMSGTSMSTPNVAGTLFLLVEHYQATHDYLAPLSSTLKAVAIHTADECGPVDGPDYTYGWGLMNAWRAADLISDDTVQPDRIQELELDQGASFSYQLSSDGSEPIRATIAWSEPPGQPYQSPALDNDLDMTITRLSDGWVYYPYVLDPDNPSAPAGYGDNDVDNVEQVYLALPEPGDYRVDVTHEGPLTEESVWFSLVLSGMLEPDPVRLTLVPSGSTQIGPDGGTLDFQASLINETDGSWSNVTFWTSTLLPSGEVFGPLFVSPVFTIQPQSALTASALSQLVPAFAPAGEYQLLGRAGVFPQSYLNDSFPFSKAEGVVVGGSQPAGGDWPAGEMTGIHRESRER